MKRLTPLCLALAACQTASSTVDGPGLWDPGFKPPAVLDTERMHLEPLGPVHAELDHEAFMASRDHLRRTLRWDGWPSDDMTVEQNRSDLQHHWREFEERSGYAYTVQSPDRSQCVGCIYLNPIANDPRGARFVYWVVEDQLAEELDRHLLASVLAWYRGWWPVDRIEFSAHVEDERSAQLFAALGLDEPAAPVDGRRAFLWERSAD